MMKAVVFERGFAKTFENLTALLCIQCSLAVYSGLTLNQDKATKPQTVPIHLVLQHLRESFSLS